MMDQRRKIKLLVGVPFLPKGSQYWLYDSSGQVFWIDRKGKVSEYPLRTGLAGYIWLLTTEPKFVKIIESHKEEI
jgi:hypothetical protein